MLLKLAAALALVTVTGAGASALARSGPLQAFRPAANGLSETAPGVFIDDPARARAMLAALTAAEAQVAAFFGAAPERPRLVFCTRAACAARLGVGKRSAVTYGDRLVVLAPKGLTPMIMAHELSHVVLHRHFGLRDLAAPRFPAWFDEGLASLVSVDTRLVSGDAAARARVYAARRFGQWGGVVTELGWREAYGAAKSLVEEMQAADGRGSLLALIDRVAAGADFEAERRHLLERGRV